MSKIINKENQKKLIITIVIVMLFNFVMPNYSFAIEGGTVLKYFAPVILMIPDLLLNKLQNIFIGGEDVDENGETIYNDIAQLNPKGGVSNYVIMYSPGVIFSGQVAGLDVNFMSPLTTRDENGIPVAGEGKVVTEWITYNYTEIDDKFDSDNYKTSLKKYGFDVDEATKTVSNSDAETYVLWFGSEVTSLTWEDEETGIQYWYHVQTSKHVPLLLYVVGALLTVAGVVGAYFTGGSSLFVSKIGLGMIAGTAAADYAVSEISKKLTGGTLYKIEEAKHKTVNVSIAYTLRNSVATFYKALMEVALVGLLLAIVYVSIRMVITTISQDKAKYKKMLWDCVCGICIIFLIHFFINIVLSVIQSINNVFAGTVVENGKDVLMSRIRTEIGCDPENTDLSETFTKIVIYLVLVIYTIQFTIIYLKRVINMAFLTIIAPLVAFTYPLDKVKDGKAQGLSTWLKEFSFNALMQPIHMILYWIFVGGSIEFATQNPIYALVMIGFLKPAEKYIRQLFGLESDSSLGKMTSALGGAAVMNAINKMGAKAKGGFKGNGGKASGGEKAGGTNKTRMANNGSDPYETLRNKNSKGANGQTKQNAGENTPGTNGQTAGGTKGVAQTEKGTTTQKAGGANTAGEKGNLKNSAGTKQGKWGARVKGGLKVAGKYSKNIARGTMRIAGAATLGTVGLAAGIATGDMSNAVAGLTGGMVAGSKLGASTVDGAVNLAKGANGVRRDIVDTYRGGKLGKDEAERIRFDKDFKKTEGYKNLVKKHEGSEETVQEFLNAGVTDVGQMDKAMESGYSTEEAIAYMKMANSDDCPDEVLNDTESFKTFLEARGIDSSNAEEIREGIAKFK